MKIGISWPSNHPWFERTNDLLSPRMVILYDVSILIDLRFCQEDIQNILGKLKYWRSYTNTFLMLFVGKTDQYIDSMSYIARKENNFIAFSRESCSYECIPFLLFIHYAMMENIATYTYSNTQHSVSLLAEKTYIFISKKVNQNFSASNQKTIRKQSRYKVNRLIEWM